LSPLKQHRQHKPHNNKPKPKPKPKPKHLNSIRNKRPNSNNAFSLLAAAAL
jgi:hypothetical protein